MKSYRVALSLAVAVAGSAAFGAKPGADGALKALQDGNERFVAGKALYANAGEARRQLAARSNQGDYAIATVVSCSDSRVPVEYIFDSGIMEVFVIRVAGNVCDTDEVGSIEYGVRHVNTPLLIVLGHSQCGAVTAVAKGLKGEGHALEKNIPPLVDNIVPAVEKVAKAFPQATMENLVNRSIEENVWKGVEDILMRSAAVRETAKSGGVRVLGAIYDLESGKVRWLPTEKVDDILKSVEANPKRETEAMAPGGHDSHPATPPPAHQKDDRKTTKSPEGAGGGQGHGGGH